MEVGEPRSLIVSAVTLLDRPPGAWDGWGLWGWPWQHAAGWATYTRVFSQFWRPGSHIGASAGLLPLEAPPRRVDGRLLPVSPHVVPD